MFMEELLDKSTPQEVVATTGIFKAYSDETDAVFTYEVAIGSTRIHVIRGGSSMEWSWNLTGGDKTMVGDLDVTDNGIVVTTEDVAMGGHHYKISAKTTTETLWSFDGRGRHGLSSDVAILGGRVYALEAASPLQYKWVVSVDLKTGKDRKIHYVEENPSVSLALIRAENKCLFLLADNAGKQALYHIGLKGGVERLSEEGTIFYPVGYGPKGSEPCYFFRRECSGTWEACGNPLKKLALPTGFTTNGIDLVSIRHKVFIHREHGHRFIDYGKRVSFWGEIETNPWLNWNGGDLDLRMYTPGQTPVKARLEKHIVIDRPATIYGGNLKHGMARSADGTSVRWLGVWSHNKKPTSLLIIGYGAYGLTTPTDTTRWRPFIEHGFAIGFAFIRGGGDHNDLWAQMGRLGGKERGVEDFEACVRALQKETGIGAAHTCLFGRSAGGYLMGTTVLRNPGGRLAKYVYTEAPYVDVLQTSSNVKLPLTVFEYLEFGDPAHSISDFEMLLRLSPIGGTGPNGAPGVFVLCRAGLNDRQVYAYESVKWMDVLRGDKAKGLLNASLGDKRSDKRSDKRKDQKKILFLTKGVGHNAHGKLLHMERAEDFLILYKTMNL